MDDQPIRWDCNLMENTILDDTKDTHTNIKQTSSIYTIYFIQPATRRFLNEGD